MCITAFSTDAQREQMSDVGYEAACVVPLPHSSPRPTDGKVLRLHAMARSDVIDMRISAAGNPMVSVEDLIELSHDKVFQVRAWVLRNPACPKWLVHDMCEDHDAAIRAGARYKLNMFG